MAERRSARHQVTENLEMQQSSEELTIDLAELMYRLLGHWKLIVGLALVVAVAMGAYTHYLVTPMYQATSTIYVLSRKDSAINMADLQIGSALTSDYIRAMDMWEVHEEVISNLDLDYTYKQVRNMVSVTNPSDTRMLDITVESPSPVEAAAMANEYAKVGSKYIEETMSTDRPNTVSVARVPANPVSPSMTKNVLLGFILGGILAAGIVTVQMLMDDKIKTADDIRKYVGLTNLATVPLEEGNANLPDNGKSKSKKKGDKKHE